MIEKLTSLYMFVFIICLKQSSKTVYISYCSAGDEGVHKDFKKACGGAVIKYDSESNTIVILVSYIIGGVLYETIEIHFKSDE